MIGTIKHNANTMQILPATSDFYENVFTFSAHQTSGVVGSTVIHSATFLYTTERKHHNLLQSKMLQLNLNQQSQIIISE